MNTNSPPILPALARLATIALCSTMASAHAETLVFGGAEGSRNSSYAYLGGVSPFDGNDLGRGWYKKTVLSMVRYSYESTEQGPVTEITGRVPGIEAGVGHAWQFEKQKLDLSATIGYRHVSLSPFDPKDEKTGSIITLNPQLIAYTPLTGKFDADLIANYAIGLGSSFARIRSGYQQDNGVRVGLEGKQLAGRTYSVHMLGAFVAIPLQGKLTLELNLGREKPKDEHSATYAGIAFSTAF